MRLTNNTFPFRTAGSHDGPAFARPATIVTHVPRKIPPHTGARACKPADNRARRVETACHPLCPGRTRTGCRYWRQVLKAIPISFFKEIRGHKWIAARALLTGWALWTVYVTTIFPLLTPYFIGGGFGVAITLSDPIDT